MIASKHLKIRFQEKGGGRTKNVLTFTEEECLSAFLNRGDISWQTPRCKDNVFIGKINGEKQYAHKRYLQWTIQELLGIINGKISVEGCSTFPDSFDKDLTFRQLNGILEKRKQYKFCNQSHMNLVPTKSVKTSHSLRLPSIKGWKMLILRSLTI